jgi:SAM-dependent methyltransferase
MYTDFRNIATYYDALYVNDNEYAPEAAKAKELLFKHGVQPQADLLILACGTGGHIPYFKNDFAVSGLDLSNDMLAVARDKYPDIRFYLGNLTDFSLQTSFDSIICMYGSIGFVKTLAGLRESLKCIAKHLRPRGLLLITPWSTEEQFHDAIVVSATDKPNIKIARMEYICQKKPKVIEVTLHHLVGRNNQIVYNTQSMEIGLFSQDEYRTAISNAGLTIVEEYVDKDVRGGAFIAKRICW